jgi:hypothetical protein
MSNVQLTTIIPTGGTTDVCQLQTVLTNGFLTQNGITGGNFINSGYMRTISFTSTNDLSGVFFTIIGVQNGVSITENVFGPNNDTVDSANYYDSVTSIQASAGAANISVGSGNQSVIFYNSGASFNSSRFMNPYMVLAIDNPSGTPDGVQTRVDGFVNFPVGMTGWEPDTSDNLVARTVGTRSVKALDTTPEYTLTKANLELYSGFAVTVYGFPSQSVYVNIVQP